MYGSRQDDVGREGREYAEIRVRPGKYYGCDDGDRGWSECA